MGLTIQSDLVQRMTGRSTRLNEGVGSRFPFQLEDPLRRGWRVVVGEAPVRAETVITEQGRRSHGTPLRSVQGTCPETPDL